MENFALPCWTEESYAVLTVRLEELADPIYREFQHSLISTRYLMWGVRMPQLRQLSKEIVRGDWRVYLLRAESHCLAGTARYEEVLLRGLVIGLATASSHSDWDEAKRLISDYLPMIDNWAVNDGFVSSLKILGRCQENAWGFLVACLDAKEEFTVRFGVTSLMSYFVRREELWRLLPLLDSVHREEYYIRMAVAWALSVCYVKFPEETMPFLQNSSLDDWTYNKTLQKILESHRANDSQKQVIRRMKRK